MHSPGTSKKSPKVKLGISLLTESLRKTPTYNFNIKTRTMQLKENEKKLNNLKRGIPNYSELIKLEKRVKNMKNKLKKKSKK